MSQSLGERLRYCGVVGAGGGGFPAAVKAAARAEFVLANGAECEPLLHKDAELMKHFPQEVLSGLALMMESVGSRQGKVCVKRKNAAAVEAILPHLKADSMEMVLLGDFYPSGDEYELVYAATGRLIPPAGIPLQVGCVVSNVETLYNVHHAANGEPVVRKLISVVGAVREPKSFWIPVGASLRHALALAGGATTPDFGVFVSGVMMGRLSFNLDDVITKTTAGLVVLPRSHYLILRRDRSNDSMERIGRSACDQCSYCTELCPRYLLGYDVVPHRVMRGLGFTLEGTARWNKAAALCCGCGLCTLYACPEELYPKEACDRAKASLRAAGTQPFTQGPARVHPMKEYRRVPQARLRSRLRIDPYERGAPFETVHDSPARVRIMVSQHAGKPAQAIVRQGDRVAAGDAVGRVPAGDLGADVHASITGKVSRVTDDFIEIEA
jgi:Na+-translocating ferredoxin:NAD+ oxidoreductase RnfC subunit